MDYAHDIMLNFNEDFFDFFEWETKDKITYFKKIPIFKTTLNNYLNIKNNEIEFDDIFLKKIKNSALLIACEEDVFGIKIKPKIQKSDLNFEDKKNALKVSKKINITSIPYHVIKKENKTYLTKKQKNNIKKIEKLIEKAYQKKEIEKLSYLYLECFNKNEKNINIIYNELKKEIYKNNNITKKITYLLNLIKNKA